MPQEYWNNMHNLTSVRSRKEKNKSAIPLEVSTFQNNFTIDVQIRFS